MTNNDTLWVDYTTPPTPGAIFAGWLNDVDSVVYSLLGNSSGPGGAGGAPTTRAQILANLGAAGANYVSLAAYNPDPTGATPSDTALSNAIAALAAASPNGGVIDMGYGTYTFANQINLANKLGIILLGRGGKSAGAYCATAITYTGSGTTPWINMNSSIGCELRSMQILYSNSGFTGVQIECGNDGTHGDPAFCGIFDCTLGGSPRTASHLTLNKSTQFVAQRCNFIQSAAAGAIIGAAAAGYANTVTIRDCQFYDNGGAPLQGGGQNWNIISNTFEGLHSGAAGAFLNTSSTLQSGMTWIGNWFGDVTLGGGTWVNFFGNGLVFEGNFVGAGGASMSYGVAINSGSDGYVIQGNYATGSELTLINIVNTGTTAGVITPNSLNSSAVLIAGASNVAGYFTGGQGYSTFPDGTIIQRGIITATVSPGGTGNAVTFPKAFVSSSILISLAVSGPTSSTGLLSYGSVTTTGFTITAFGTAGTETVSWTAIGN